MIGSYRERKIKKTWETSSGRIAAVIGSCKEREIQKTAVFGGYRERKIKKGNKRKLRK